MFAVAEYERYADLQKHADFVYGMACKVGDNLYSFDDANKAQQAANAAYETYEYAAGIKSYDY